MKYLLLLLAFILPFFSVSQPTTTTILPSARSFSVEDQSQTVMPLLQEVESHFRTFDYERASLLIQNALAQNPSSPEALLLSAKLKKRMGMEQEAQMDYQSATRLNPFVADLYGYFGKGGLLNLLYSEPEGAILGLNTSQKLTYYYQALDQNLLEKKITDDEYKLLSDAIEAIEAGELANAASILDDIVESYPGSAVASDLRGMVSAQDDNMTDAGFHFNNATLLDSSFAISWYNLGRIELANHNYGTSKTYFDRALQLQNDLTMAYFGRALVYKAMGNFEEALSDYDEIIKIREDLYKEAYVNRGLTKKIAGDFNGALADLNQVITEFPDDPALRNNRGNLNLLFGLDASALVDYTEAIRLDSNFAEAYYNRALAHFQLYDKVSACADLERSEELGFEKSEELIRYFCTY